VVAEALGRHGIKARLMPGRVFFLKPLTTAWRGRCARNA